MKFANILLKSVPYLLSIAGGIILYTGAIDNAPNDNLRDLVINVSASLLSIPLVFLLYDYSNYLVSRRMTRHLENSMADKLNSVMFSLILLLRQTTGTRTKLSVEGLNKMLTLPLSQITRRLHLTASVLQRFHDIHDELDELLYRSGQSGVLSSDQFQILASLSRDMSHLINENKFRHDRHQTARRVSSVMARILDWLDSDAVAALHLRQNLNSDAPLPDDKK
ncbi:MAG: hypothetical protein IJD52_00890 [Alphaproteobacteria bacterium]|nr:hypothetical protein [Alphaproteobacteria bacterium]